MENQIPRKRVSWTEMLDILTDSERRKHTIIKRSTEFERTILFLLRREGWSAQINSSEEKNYELEIFKPSERVAVQVRNQRGKVHLGQVEKFLQFLSEENRKSFTGGVFISANGFTPSVYAYLREERITNLRLAVLKNERLIWNSEALETEEEEKKHIYIGVFTCKGGVGKTTIAAHLAGAFALNGYDVALVDLDHQQNLKKLLGKGVYLPATKGDSGSKLMVLSQEEWKTNQSHDAKIVVCDCNPEFEANSPEFIRKFDYCLIPTTLNPLGVNKNGDVIKRTFNAIRQENSKAHLFVLVNNFQNDEENRNILLNQFLKSQFKQLSEKDPRCHYIDPTEVAIRYSKQLLYWGFHIFENNKPQLAFRSQGGYSYPRMDFLKLVDYLELKTKIKQAFLSPIDLLT